MDKLIKEICVKLGIFVAPEFVDLTTNYGRMLTGICSAIVVGGAPFSSRPCFRIVYTESGIAPDWRSVGNTVYFEESVGLSHCPPNGYLITNEEAMKWQYDYYRQNPNAW